MPPQLESKRGRNQAVEVGRLVAAIAIVWLHTVGGAEMSETSRWMRWAVPFFIGASLWFGGPSCQNQPIQFIKDRFWRLYPLFLIWNVFYLVVRLVASAVMNGSFQQSPSTFLQSLFFDGFAHHLWFLPFLLLVHLVQALGIALKPPMWFSPLAAVACLVGYEFIPPGWIGGGYLAELAWWSVPAALWAVAIGFLVRRVSLTGRAGIQAVWGMGFLILGALVMAWSVIGPRDAMLEGLSGVLLFFGAMLIGESGKVSFPDRLNRLAALSGGIYLIHVFFIEGFQDVISMRFAAEESVWVISVFILATLSSVAAVGIARSVGLGWLFDGFGRRKAGKC
ncbi:acyltransferase [Haloferula chungangensis]|uniref:Acyltransferase n=1 Tax=Haloferula chungangensis TaxID=1048331 RepID=A0ABW2L8W1_9BACT